MGPPRLRLSARTAQVASPASSRMSARPTVNAARANKS